MKNVGPFSVLPFWLPFLGGATALGVKQHSSPADEAALAEIAMASGHVGYDWDLKTDSLVWHGNWPSLFGTARSRPPHNAESFATAVFSDDHYLVFDNNNAAFDREYRLLLPEGRLVWVHEHGTTDHENGKAVRQRGLMRLIEDPRHDSMAENVVAHERDNLTGRPNRAAMQGQLAILQRGPKELRQQSAFMVIGIDKMAFVNEAVGTKSGDVLLCGVVERLAELSPSKAFLARVGGDSFGIILPGLAREAAPLAERILQSFRDHPVVTPAAPLHITVSIGSTRLSDPGMEASEIMIHAEQALREARARGRNQYVEYQGSPERSLETRNMMEIGERVKQVLKEDKLRLAYQPVVDAQTSQPVFYEALARLFREDGSMISAAQFIPIVEQQGLAVEFDRHVVGMVIRELEAYPDISIAVNISGITASQSDWPEYIQKILSPKRDVAKRLIIEITETAAIIDIAETQRFIKILRELGGQVSMDDFGVGFTSISYLRTLALAIMKIDKELLNNLVENAEQQHLVRMLIGIARGLGIRTVAEGVETADVAAWLREEKVDMMQGYYFAKPSLEKDWEKAKA